MSELEWLKQDWMKASMDRQNFIDNVVNGLPSFISETVSEYGGGFIDWFDV